MPGVRGSRLDQSKLAVGNEIVDQGFYRLPRRGHHRHIWEWNKIHEEVGGVFLAEQPQDIPSYRIFVAAGISGLYAIEFNLWPDHLVHRADIVSHQYLI